MRGELRVKGTGVQQARVAVLQAAIVFLSVMVCGTLLTAVLALFAYANAPDPNAHDSRFLMLAIAGAVLSALAGGLAANRTIRAGASSDSGGAAYSLLKKYRRADVRPGTDAQAGQYQIGERYLRQLLGRRGA